MRETTSRPDVYSGIKRTSALSGPYRRKPKLKVWRWVIIGLAIGITFIMLASH